MKNLGKFLLVSALGAAISLGTYKIFFEKPEVRTVIQPTETPVYHTGMADEVAPEGFSYAAEKTVNSVVHVKTAIETEAGVGVRSPLDFFFGTPRNYSPQPRLQMGSGSGVIISEDGYIVTNNHVVARAEKIQVVLNSGLEYEGKVVGTDPATDIALIKIKTEDLPFLTFSNSDNIKLGEWVLAVGNPFNLTSTVTAGIVSAKSRSIGIINERTAIESFIQTDAAVNPGNSGGALVNTRGELIGINSAISSRTGSYEGYSFAVPSNIVKKVVEDLLEHGTVQRAFLGVNISDISSHMVEELDLAVKSGVYVHGVTENGAAEEAGLRSGDVITAVDGREIKKSSELQELIGRKRPGDKVKLQINRDGKERSYELVLRNFQGTTDVVRPRDNSFMAKLGAELEPVDARTRKSLGISHGLEVKSVKKGILARHGVPEGFVITHINRQPVEKEEDINEAVKDLKPRDAVVIQGYTPDGRARYFAFGY